MVTNIKIVTAYQHFTLEIQNKSNHYGQKMHNYALKEY